jgi:hypothetical protein
MTTKDLELWINNDHYLDTVSIWLRKETHNGSAYYSLGDDGIVKETIIEGVGNALNGLKPFIQMPRRFASAFIELLTNEAKRVGISIKEESEMKGKLLSAEKEIEFLKAQLEKFVNKATR